MKTLVEEGEQLRLIEGSSKILNRVVEVPSIEPGALVAHDGANILTVFRAFRDDLVDNEVLRPTDAYPMACDIFHRGTGDGLMLVGQPSPEEIDTEDRKSTRLNSSH